MIIYSVLYNTLYDMSKYDKKNRKRVLMGDDISYRFRLYQAGASRFQTDHRVREY